MSIFEWVIVVWLVMLTIWLVYFKRGPKGKKGEPYSINYSDIVAWQIRDASIELVDDAEYMSKLIQRINSLQLQTRISQQFNEDDKLFINREKEKEQ